jgi:hypothetical protein
MRTSVNAVILTLLMATPLFAQQATTSTPTTNGYITAVGGLSYFSNISGFSTAGKQGTGTLGADVGLRIAPHLMVFGDGGWLPNFQKGLQPLLLSTTNSLYDSHAISTTGTGTLRALYGLGGLNLAGPALGQFTPYVLGGVGVARLTPTTHFTYHSGTIPGQTTAPAANADVTASLISAKLYTAPGTSSPLMFMAGGGLRLALAQHALIDAEYRYSRIAADSALSAPAESINAITFGAGYRF